MSPLTIAALVGVVALVALIGKAKPEGRIVTYDGRRYRVLRIGAKTTVTALAADDSPLVSVTYDDIKGPVDVSALADLPTEELTRIQVQLSQDVVAHWAELGVPYLPPETGMPAMVSALPPQFHIGEHGYRVRKLDEQWNEVTLYLKNEPVGYFKVGPEGIVRADRQLLDEEKWKLAAEHVKRDVLSDPLAFGLKLEVEVGPATISGPLPPGYPMVDHLAVGVWPGAPTPFGPAYTKVGKTVYDILAEPTHPSYLLVPSDPAMVGTMPMMPIWRFVQVYSWNEAAKLWHEVKRTHTPVNLPLDTAPTLVSMVKATRPKPYMVAVEQRWIGTRWQVMPAVNNWS